MEPKQTNAEDDRSNNFDLLRLLAAGQVALWHGAKLLKVGALAAVPETWNILPGVPVFFVISGFLVTLSHERSRSGFQYFLNRFLRIYPALWICLAVSLAIVFAFRLPYSFGGIVLWIGAQVSVAQFYNPAFIRGFGVGVMNGSLWTIPVELQFYLAIPLLYAASSRLMGRFADTRLRQLPWIALAVACMAVFTAISHALVARQDDAPWTKMYDATLIPWLYYFLVGLLYRRAFEIWPSLFRGRLVLWAIAFAVWTSIAKWGLGWEVVGNTVNPVTLLIIGGCTVSAAFTMPTLSRRLIHGNDISYGMYIYHMLIVNVFVQIGFTGTPISLVAMLALTLLLGTLSWRFVEQPMLALKHHPIWSRLESRLRRR